MVYMSREVSRQINGSREGENRVPGGLKSNDLKREILEETVEHAERDRANTAHVGSWDKGEAEGFGPRIPPGALQVEVAGLEVIEPCRLAGSLKPSVLILSRVPDCEARGNITIIIRA